jgi:hypothetical protein
VGEFYFSVIIKTITYSAKIMGLIFKRPTKSGNVSFKYKVADSQISNKYVREVAVKVSPKFALGKSSAKKRFAKDLFDKTLTRENVHEALEKRVQAGDVSIKNAKKIEIELGVTEKRFQKFDKQGPADEKISPLVNDRRIGKNKSPIDRLEALKNKKRDAAKKTSENQKTPKASSNVPASLPVSNPTNSLPDDEKKSKITNKPSTIWEILNKGGSHTDISPRNSQENG